MDVQGRGYVVYFDEGSVAHCVENARADRFAGVERFVDVGVVKGTVFNGSGGVFAFLVGVFFNVYVVFVHLMVLERC